MALTIDSQIRGRDQLWGMVEYVTIRHAMTLIQINAGRNGSSSYSQ